MASTNISDLPYTTPPVTQALPERDIPRETIQHTVDPQATVQYMPPRQPDYIPPAPSPQSKMDYSKIMEQMRLPVLLSLLYFIFQMDSFQSLLRRLVPSLFSDAGNISSKGLLVKSGLFGAAFYLLTQVLEHLSRP